MWTVAAGPKAGHLIAKLARMGLGCCSGWMLAASPWLCSAQADSRARRAEQIDEFWRALQHAFTVHVSVTVIRCGELIRIFAHRGQPMPLVGQFRLSLEPSPGLRFRRHSTSNWTFKGWCIVLPKYCRLSRSSPTSAHRRIEVWGVTWTHQAPSILPSRSCTMPPGLAWLASKKKKPPPRRLH